MTTINLHQTEQTEQTKVGNGGLFLALGILICTLLVLAGFKIAASTLQKQNQTLLTQIEAEKSSLIAMNNVKQVADMQARLAQIKNNLQIKNGKVSLMPMTQILGYVGDSINSSGVFLGSYKYEEGNKIQLTINAVSFSDAAKQIFNLKNSKYFSNVSLADINSEGKYIRCDVDMSIKQ